jgi:hypothetical protein
MDTEVSRRRDALPVSKQSRDALRNGNTALKQRNGLLGNASLLRDFEDKVVSTYIYMRVFTTGISGNIKCVLNRTTGMR